MKRIIIGCSLIAGLCISSALATEPVVAIHFSELTQALETTVAHAPTPTGTGTTGCEWWTPWWHYFVMPESLKEALRSDGTPFVVVSDSDISAGRLLTADGKPRYPILISLAAEAIRDDEIVPLRSYVAAGGFLFVGSSSFTRNPDGTGRGNFALSAEMGVSSATSGLQNWAWKQRFFKLIDHRLVSHIPSEDIMWRMPLTAEDIPVGISPNHAQPENHYAWQVTALDAQVVATSSASPYLLTKTYGLGTFIYDAAMQPLMGHGGVAPGMYAYGIFRNAIEWAFEAAGLPLVRVSPWPYVYNAAYVVRHDYDVFPWEIQHIELSSQTEHTYGAKGEYYFCTGWLRDEMADSPTIVANLRNAVSLYGATIGSHNGGLRNPNNPSLATTDYDYWHWGPDEALDANPPGYASGYEYALASLSLAFADVDRWLTGLSTNKRTWTAPYFNSTRDASNQILEQLGAVSAGEQKLSPFPHWTVSTQTPGKLFQVVSLPTSEWYIGSLVSQSMDVRHDSTTVRALVDYYYSLGALVNLYSHHSSHGGLPFEYLTYCASKPAIWPTNSAEVAAWWEHRTPVQVTSNCTSSTDTFYVTAEISGATDPETAIELAIPNWAAVANSALVTLDGVPAGQDQYRTYHNGIKIKVGNSVSTVQVSYIYNGLVAQNDQYSVLQGNTLRIAAPGVLGNDVPGGAPGMTAALVSPTSSGALMFQADGSFEYTSAAGFSGTDSFTYQIFLNGEISNTATVSIVVTPLAVSSLALDPLTVLCGSPSQGLVALNGPAPAGGAVVGLTSSMPTVVQVPANVTVAAGQITAAFTVTTSSYPMVAYADITASYGGSSASAMLTVSPTQGQVLFSDDFSGPPGSDPLWTSVLGTWGVNGGVMTGTNTANHYGYTRANGNWTDYRLRGRFLFPSGTYAGGFAGRVNASTGARYSFLVYPTAFGSPTMVVFKFWTWGSWGGTFMGRATLPSLGTSWHTVEITFEGNRIRASFDSSQVLDITDNNFDSRPPYTSGGISLDIVEGGTSQVLQFDDILVTAVSAAPVAALTGLSVSPVTVLGGVSATGTATLSMAAPVGGAVVALSSNNTTVAQVPSTVTVAEGETQAAFQVTTSPVAVDTAVTITAVYNGVTRTSPLTVTSPAAALTGLSVSPATVPGGSASTGTVTLDVPAPAGGSVVSLSSSNTAAAQVPSTVTVLAGLTSATFTVTTGSVSAETPVTITAVYSGVTQTALLTVAAPIAGLSSVSVSPASVLGGDISTGTVTLDFPAPAGGAVIALSSSDPAAQVPATVTVPAGQTSATFSVTSSPVSADTPVTITGGYNGVGRTALLTVAAPIVDLASVSVSPASVLGGNSSTGTVTLDLPAPAGGALVSLSSSNTAAAPVPATVTVPAGQTSATFSVTTSPVSADTPVTITGGYNGVERTALLTVTAPVAVLTSVGVSPASVPGASSSTGTVTLDIPAPVGGALVSLSSSNTAAAQVPATVTVPAGQTSATFSVTTSPVAADTTVTITASYNSAVRTALLTVTAPVAVLTSVGVSPASVLGGSSSTGTVTLDLPAPAGGATVSLSSSNTAAAQVPVTVTVPAGQTTATFMATTSPVAADATVTITASYASAVRTALMTVTAPVAVLTSVGVSPASVLGGSSSTGTVTLDLPAPAGGAVIALSSSDPAAQVPATVAVQAGQTSATFSVTTSPVAADATVTITASYASAVRTALLTVTAPVAVLTSVGVSPASVLGGSSSTGTVTLDIPAPAGGALVSLSSSNTAAAQVPATATVPAGQTTANFTVTTSPVAADASVMITATYRAATHTALMTVTAPVPTPIGVSVNPSTVLGGVSSTGTVTLNQAAPTGGALVNLSSNNTAAAQVPTTVTVPAGQTTSTFTVTTSPVAADTVATISATYNAVTQTVPLMVTAATLTSLTLSPTSVTGGSPSTGTVTLSGRAPAGGALVSLSSNNTAAAQAPATVTVPAGATTAAFLMTTSDVSANTSVSISAVYRGVTRTASLTVTAITLTSVTPNPTSVVGGNPSTGTVVLSGPAPYGGAIIGLTSNNASAQVPVTVTIPAGATQGTFTITTSSVTRNTSARISARYRGVVRHTTLTITPR